ncbi:MAG: hypothetical protein ACTHN4_00240 [Sphingomicrobium sp.]
MRQLHLHSAAFVAVLLASAANAQSTAPMVRAIKVAPTAAQKMGIVVPNAELSADVAQIAPAAAAPALPDTVLLQSASPAASIQQLQVERQLSASDIGSTRALKLGSSTIDLSAMLQNRDALPNVANRLRAAPEAVSVKASDITAYVVPQGLVVRSFLNYQLKAGTCSDAGRRSQIEQAGIACARKLSDSERVAGYSDPSSPRYVQDPGKRADAIAKARQDWAAQDAETATQIANFRAILANPTERAKIEAAIGPQETARIEQLSDDQLAGELINSAETKIEDVMFIPKADVLDQEVKGVAVADGATTVSSGSRLQDLAGRLGGRLSVLEPATLTPTPNQPIDPVFLTGFTLGRQYEWSKRIEKTINWCWVGCSVTYYAGAQAGFSYGFGLRFPIVVDGKYSYAKDDSGEHAYLTATMTPVDGSPAQYAASGLASSQIFNGQEFVAELQANAGYEYKLPLIGEDQHSLTVGYDLADKLPAPYTHGQFRPPAPGTNAGEIPFVLNDIDLLAGYGNWGAAGIQVHPAVKVGLHSDALKLMLHDNVANSDQQIVNGQRMPLAINAAARTSSFSIGSPVYNLGFIVTPGVDAHAFIDVGVWSDSWDFPVWFPDVAITLPPGGVDFSCHAGTVCRRDYLYTAAFSSDPTVDTGGLTVKGDDAGLQPQPQPGLKDKIRDLRQNVLIRPRAVVKPKPEPTPETVQQPQTPQ